MAPIGNIEKIRESLIAAACELFATAGYAETTVKQIAKRAGMDVRLFSYYFESKEELLRAAIENLVEQEIAVFEQIAGSYESPIQQYAAMIREMMVFRRSKGMLVGLVKKRSVAVNFHFRELFMEKAAPVQEKVIVDGIRMCEMRVMAPRQTAQLIINNMFYVFSNFSGQDEYDKRKMIDAFLDMTEASLGIPEGMLRAAIAQEGMGHEAG